MSKLDGLVVRWSFVSTNGRKMQILGVFSFKISSWTDYCLSSWFVHQKLNTFSALFVRCRLSLLSWFQGLKSVPLSFWPQVTNHDGKSKLLKTWLLMSLLFHTTFSWCWKTEEKTKKTWRFWYAQNKRLLFKKLHQKNPKFNLGKILYCWKNLGMLCFSRFLDQICATTTLHT